MGALVGNILLGWLRHAVTVWGASLVTSGLLNSDQANQLTGAVLVIVPIALSAYDKWQTLQKSNAALVAQAKAMTQGTSQ